MIKDPLATGTCSATVKTACFANNVIPTARFNPVAVNLMAYYPLPNLTGSSNFIANVPSVDNWDNFLFKVDQRVGSRDSLSVRALLRWESSTNPFSGNGLGTFGATTDS